MARSILVGLTLVFTAFPLAAALGLWLLAPDPQAILRAGPGEIGALLAGLFAPPAAAFLAAAHLLQRRELGLLREAVARGADALALQQQQLAVAIREYRAQTDLVRQHGEVALDGLRLGKRQIEAIGQHMAETRALRLASEWDLTVRELTIILTTMFRLAFGWRRVGGSEDEPTLEEVSLPGAEELALRILRMLPASPREGWTLEVDPRFARHGRRYQEVYSRFLARLPRRAEAAGGTLDRAFFEASIYGQIHARLSSLPRADETEAEPEVGAAAD
jgi:hypothetical protein